MKMIEIKNFLNLSGLICNNPSQHINKTIGRKMRVYLVANTKLSVLVKKTSIERNVIRMVNKNKVFLLTFRSEYIKPLIKLKIGRDTKTKIIL